MKRQIRKTAANRIFAVNCVSCNTDIFFEYRRLVFFELTFVIKSPPKQICKPFAECWSFDK